MKKRFITQIKRFAAIVLTVALTTGNIPADSLFAFAENEEEYTLDNGYIKAEVSKENGGFLISTVKGDKINKDDDNKALLFHNGVDDTSFTSFRVTRGNDVKEYVFGGDYEGSSDIAISKASNEITATWSVDNITFTQTISLVNSGSSEHGMAYISYSAKNNGEKADIKARVLMDTAFNYQDYAYYNIGSGKQLVEQETTLGEDGYNKSFYGYDDPFSPTTTSYFVNASIDNKECKPYQTIIAHWNNLASSIFDYTSDPTLNFTNQNNKKYLTADSAVAFYYNMGEVQKNASGAVALNYGVFSNEHVKDNDNASVNITAPDVLELNNDRASYKDDGNFTIKTNIKNIGKWRYDRVRVVVYATSGIRPLNEKGEDIGATYENPFSIDYTDFSANKTQTTEWKFKATPMEEGQYATIHYKVYDVSNNNELLAKNLIGEGRTYILCPGSVNEVPAIQFTAYSPDIIYSEGKRNLTITGNNFSMLMDKSSYSVRIRRMDGYGIDNVDSIEIPSDNVMIDAEKNTMTLAFTDDNPGKLPEGQYEAYIHYTAADKEDITAPALRFQVKDDVKYRNDTYGVLVAQASADLSDKYSIVEYESEEAYREAIANDKDLKNRSLLEFRGIFTKKTVTNIMGDKIVYTGISLNDDDNVMTLNNCLDIKSGMVTITQDREGITVDFDAKILISGEGTMVWNGICALTELKNGTKYGLIPYEENGERKDFNYETITLLWPSIGQAAHNLLGMIMDFKYAELGKIEHEGADETRVVAFGASLNLSFVSNKTTGLDTATALDKAFEDYTVSYSEGCSMLRKINDDIPYNTYTVNTDADDDDDVAEFTGKIQIDDVLFGGKYLGVCFTVSLGIPSYVEGLPDVEGELTVKTVGNWEIGVSGTCEFEMFSLEAEIGIKSNGKMIIPDKFRIFLGNITPGINVDGMGILWLQGAGGGIDNLYDTIFLTDSVPPLQLLIEAQFSLMQVISARAALELSLRGINVELKDGQIANSITVLDKAKLELDWYPEFYFAGAVNVNIMDAIIGGGYIVAEDNGFFEFFIRAALMLPDNIPIVGGMNIANAGLGANKDKLWGQVNVIGITVGLIYYWGGSIEWGGGAEATPTYPDLIGMNASEAGNGHYKGDVPVYYDDATGKTLYMHTGTNINNRTKTEKVNKFKTGSSNNISLLATDISSKTGLYSDSGFRAAKNKLQTLVGGKEHLLKLAQKRNDEVLTLQWSADSKEEAETLVSKIKIADNQTDEKYAINLFNHSKTAEAQVNANANLSYDEETKTAILAITFTDGKYFNREWKITTDNVCSAILYDLDEMPELSGDTTVEDISNNKMTVNLKGTALNNYDKVIFTAVPKESNKDTILLYQKKADVKEEKITFELPYDLESGDYILRIMASDDDNNYYSSIDKSFTYENPNQPKKPSKVSVKAGGNYQMNIDVTKPDNKIDGYRINVYDSNGNVVSGLEGLMYTADGNAAKYDDNGKVIKSENASDKLSFTVGGQYSYYDESSNEDKIVGLQANKKYVAGISTWKVSADGVVVYSEEIKSDKLTIPDIYKTTFRISSDSESINVEDERKNADGSIIRFNTPYYKNNNLLLTIETNDYITGMWKLDGGERQKDKGNIKNKKKISLDLKDLSEGSHVLEITGTNSHNDAVKETYTFGIDSEGPRLLISSPVSGSVYDQTGNVKISGISDEATKLTIADKNTGKIYLSNYELNVDRTGVFEKEINLDTSEISSDLILRAVDRIGNVTEKEIKLVNPAMGMIKSIDMYTGDALITNKVISSGGTYKLSVKANLSDGRVFDITDSYLVEWSQSAKQGNADLTENNGSVILKTDKDAEGILTARFRINDAGSYSVSAVFKSTGMKSLNDTNVSITYNDETYFTGNEVEALPKVYYAGELLEEGIDYTVYYENNIEVTNDKNKAKFTITGQGEYFGNVTKEFDIVYLDSDGTYDIISSKGNDNWYTHDVRIVPKEGYMISDISQSEGYSETQIVISEEGTNSKDIYIMRISDGAISDKIHMDIRIDKSAPKGSIIIDASISDRFDPKTIFNIYKLKDNAFNVMAEDNISGIASIQYMVSENVAYNSIEELIESKPVWKKYNILNPPRAEEGKKQVIYTKFTDKAGNISYLNSKGILNDITAPKITDVHIKEDESLKSVQADIAFTVNEPGEYYYAVLPEGSVAPSAEQIFEGNVEGAVIGSGIIKEEEAGYEKRCTVVGLNKDTSYMVYIVAKDMALDINTGKSAANCSDVFVSKKAVKTQNVLVDMNSTNLTFEMKDSVEYTGQEIKPLVTVKNGDYILKENIDYTLSWDNNTDVTDKARVTVKGIGDYTGEHVMEFSITYLNSKDKYEVKGVKGTDDWYQSVAIIPAYGYEIEPAIEIKEGNNNLSFRIRRISDNALSDIIKLDIKKDETKPSGKLILEDNEWSEFNPDVKNIEVHNKTNKITITSADNLSGVSKIEYAISESNAYETENEVQNSKLEWKEYKSDKAIDISINKDTVIYVKITDKAGNVKYINSDLIKYHSQEESTEEITKETTTDEESITEKEVDEKASEKTTKHSDKKVKTGDEAPIIIWAIVIVICIAGLVVVWKGKKKN